MKKTDFRIFASPQKVGNNFVAKISTGNNGWRQEFFFDSRTKTIRIASMTSYVLSNAERGGLASGKQVQFRKFKGQIDQSTRSNNNNILNKKGLCLTSLNNLVEEHNTLTWWDCSEANNAQLWQTKWIHPKDFATPLKDEESSKIARKPVKGSKKDDKAVKEFQD